PLGSARTTIVVLDMRILRGNDLDRTIGTIDARAGASSVFAELLAGLAGAPVDREERAHRLRRSLRELAHAARIADLLREAGGEIAEPPRRALRPVEVVVEPHVGRDREV